MSKKITSLAAGIAIAVACSLVARADQKKSEKKDQAADDRGYIDCEMTFDMKGWSAFYKTAKGTGRVTCSNGQARDVAIVAKGGGLTAGKTSIEDGRGQFSNLRDIDEIFGSYANAEAHAGATEAATAQAMTKGEVSLALSGTGRGWSLGFSFGKFTIKPARGGDKAAADRSDSEG